MTLKVVHACGKPLCGGETIVLVLCWMASKQQVSKSASSILKSSWWSWRGLASSSVHVVLTLTKAGSSCKQDVDTKAKLSEDIMDAAFTTIKYLHVERRMLNGAAGSCQWGKAFPLAGLDVAASLQHSITSGARHGLQDWRAAGCCYFYLQFHKKKKKSDKPS